MNTRFVTNSLALFALTALIGSATQAQTTYSVTAIPLPKGAASAIGRALNSNGEVVGSSSSSTGWYWCSSVNNGNPVSIPAPSGTSGTLPMMINANGYVVGHAPSYAFVWKNGVNGGQAILLNHDSFYGPENLVVINDANQIVSTQDVVADGISVPHGCVWEMNSLGGWQGADLPALEGDNCSLGFALNNNGLVLGVSFQGYYDPTGQFIAGPHHLIQWQKDTISGAWIGSAIPDTVTGAIQYRITNVNIHGEVAGWAYPANGGEKGFFLDTVTQIITPLGDLGGGRSRTRGLNDAGQVCGWSALSDGSNRAVYWDKTHGANNWLNLGTLGGSSSRASGSPTEVGNRHINSAGYVVGYSSNSKGSTYGFVWDAAHGMRDLNAITPKKAGFSDLDNAWEISDSGQITGWGYVKGKQTAYLLTPQP